MDFTYKLSGEQIYEKVGHDVELEYPNEAFYSVVRYSVATLSLVLLVAVAFAPTLTLPLMILHIDFVFMVAYVTFLLRKGRGWINTLLACIDTIFVIEEVVRRRRVQARDTGPQYSITRRKPPEDTYDVEQGKSGEDSAFLLDVPIDKLNQALKGGRFKNF